MRHVRTADLERLEGVPVPLTPVPLSVMVAPVSDCEPLVPVAKLGVISGSGRWLEWGS